MNDLKYMEICLKLARKAAAKGEVPVGAIVVRNQKIVGLAHNQKERLQNPTSHAEIIAIQRASRKLKNWRLTDCTLYVNLEPCPMCAGAIVQSRIQKVVFGCRDPKSGAVSSLYTLTQDPRLNHRAETLEGVLADESSQLLSSFFKSRR